jgi:hypothetical protein
MYANSSGSIGPDSEVAEHQREVVHSLVRECAELSLPLVVDPSGFRSRVKIPKATLGNNAALKESSKAHTRQAL